jgi:hypothetical protein
MSSNLSVVNFAVGGTLTVSGTTTLAQSVLSSSSGSFQGLSTTTLGVSGTSTFDNSLPTSTQTPTSNTQLTTKIYVDSADTVLNNRITSVDSSRKTYIDDADTVLNNRITNTDADQRTYIDGSYNTLNTRITDVDASRKTYIDNADTALGTRITNIGIKPLFYAHQNTSNAQTIPNNAMTKVFFPVILHNVLNKYSTGDYNFTGFSYGGFYQMNASVCLPNITNGYIAIFKNGVEYSRGSSFSSSTTSADTTLTVSTLIYINGIQGGDVCDCRVICSPSVVISGSQSKTFFTGHFIQP